MAGLKANSDKQTKADANEYKIYTWRRSSCYVFKDTGKLLMIKTICHVMNNKPLKGETMVACYEITPQQMADAIIDRVITVDGTNGCLALCDSNIYIEFKDDKIVGEDVLRTREVIPTTGSARNGRKIRIGNTALREISESKESHLSMRELSETLEKLGVVGFHAKKPAKDTADDIPSTSTGASKKQPSKKDEEAIAVV